MSTLWSVCFSGALLPKDTAEAVAAMRPRPASHELQLRSAEEKVAGGGMVVNGIPLDDPAAPPATTVHTNGPEADAALMRAATEAW